MHISGEIRSMNQYMKWGSLAPNANDILDQNVRKIFALAADQVSYFKKTRWFWVGLIWNTNLAKVVISQLIVLLLSYRGYAPYFIQYYLTVFFSAVYCKDYYGNCEKRYCSYTFDARFAEDMKKHCNKTCGYCTDWIKIVQTIVKEIFLKFI